MTTHCRTKVSRASIALPLALLATLSAAVVSEARYVTSKGRDASVASPETVRAQPRSFAYRSATEYFRKGLAVDAPKQEMRVAEPLEITRFQISRREYQHCVDDGACAPAEYERTSSPHEFPVTGVSYDDAVRYAAWLSDRTGSRWELPSDFELAFAAADRFPDDALGVDPNETNPAVRWLADYEREARRAASVDPRPQPRGSFGVSETGLADFGGNVWEWTSTCNTRVDLDKPAASQGASATGCGVMITAGRHRSPMSTFVRNPKGGGCSVGSPPDNLGFRLVKRPTIVQNVAQLARGFAADAAGILASAWTEKR